MQIQINGTCNTSIEDIQANMKASQACYPYVKWATETDKPFCAVVGAGPSLKKHLPILREWKGDIFAVNDTAGWLSDHGIASYLYMIDAQNDTVRTGIRVKGAILASRCNPNKFFLKDIRIYDMAEDYTSGIGGGPSAACRAPDLFLKMGYAGIAFFGCDSCFDKVTHLTGKRTEAYDKMIIVRTGGIDYITNSALLLQASWLAEHIQKYPRFLLNCSDGLLKATLENKGDYRIIAIAEDVKQEIGAAGAIWTKEYEPKNVWAA